MTVKRAADKGEKEGVVSEMVDAPKVEVTKEEQKVLSDEQVEELNAARARAQVVTEATKETVTDPEIDGVMGVTEAPRKAGTVEVQVVHDVFNFIDENGVYQSYLKGQKVKVSSAQAKRAEELGAVERA